MDLNKLENFLIENSDINRDFIRDFFGVQKTQKFIKYKPQEQALLVRCDKLKIKLKLYF